MDEQLDRRASDQRLARLEGGFETVVTRLETLDRKLDSLIKTRATEARTQWGPIMGAAALVLTIIGLFISGYGSDLNRMERNLDKLTERFLVHIGDGHPKWVNEKIERVKGDGDHREQRLGMLESRVNAHQEEDAASDERLKIIWGLFREDKD